MRRQTDGRSAERLSVADNHPSGANCDLSSPPENRSSNYSNSSLEPKRALRHNADSSGDSSGDSSCDRWTDCSASASDTDYPVDTDQDTYQQDNLQDKDRAIDRCFYQTHRLVNSHKSVQNHLEDHLKSHPEAPLNGFLNNRRRYKMGPFVRPGVFDLLFVCLLMISFVCGGGERTYVQLMFESEENLSVNTLIGQIRVPDALAGAHTQPPYLFMPVNGQQKGCSADTDFHIDQHTGDIRNAVRLDRERCALYKFLAISLKGLSFQISIRVLDVNDHRPLFAVPSVSVRLPENARPNETKRQLPPATDLDSPQFGLQTYRIKSGNLNDAFRLITHRESDGVLYADLQVNRELDRETVGQYRLVVEALDGGQPPLAAELEVNVILEDVNDCHPQFDRSVYSAKVPQNTTIGSRILQVGCFFQKLTFD